MTKAELEESLIPTNWIDEHSYISAINSHGYSDKMDAVKEMITQLNYMIEHDGKKISKELLQKYIENHYPYKFRDKNKYYLFIHDEKYLVAYPHPMDFCSIINIIYMFC